MLCPQIVKHYNRHIGGVDLADMLIALYQSSIKSHRWYLNIFSQILDICINNGWLLRRRYYKSSNIKIKADHLKQFRYDTYAALIKKNRQMATTNRDSVAENKRPDSYQMQLALMLRCQTKLFCFIPQKVIFFFLFSTLYNNYF